MTITVGTSGWSYDHRDGVLHRHGLPAGERLARYVEELDTVELNASFYRWPPPARFARWRERLPPGFVMSVKAPRGLTHARRLHGPDHHHLDGGSYSDADLAWWADRAREWAADGRDVLCYVNNDGDGNAVRNARTLRDLLRG